jgi:hypothetical protein
MIVLIKPVVFQRNLPYAPVAWHYVTAAVLTEAAIAALSLACTASR